MQRDADASRSPAARSRRRLGLVLLVVVLAVKAVVLAPHVGGALTALRTPDPRWLLLAVVAELLSMLAFARVQRRVLASGAPGCPCGGWPRSP